MNQHATVRVLRFHRCSLLHSFAFHGYEGVVVRVEVDLRRGIPGMDIVGLPDAGVRESRERIRVAIRNSGFRFPTDRVLVNLAPGDVKKAGSHFDLPIAVSILAASNAVPGLADAITTNRSPLIGELDLSGQVHGVRGVLSAVASALELGMQRFVVPAINAREATALRRGEVLPVTSIHGAVRALLRRPTDSSGTVIAKAETERLAESGEVRFGDLADAGDFSEMAGSRSLKRALVIAVAGRHHALLVGPPGSGKTMASMPISTLLPTLNWSDALAVTKIHSLAGVLEAGAGIVTQPPVSAPHHTASIEGLIGGGREFAPGEASLSHRGVLVLDEACEFRPSILQSLREPIEAKQVTIVRAGNHTRYPADFQLLLTSNACPCGNMGREDEACLCSRREIQVYWKRLGGPLIDRVDIRLHVTPPSSEDLLGSEGLSSETMRADIARARHRQQRRFGTSTSLSNRDIPPARFRDWVRATADAESLLSRSGARISISARSQAAVMRLARSIADIEDSLIVESSHVEEAMSLRRLGDGDLFWRYHTTSSGRPSPR